MSALRLVHDDTRPDRPLPGPAGTATAGCMETVPQRSLGEGRLSVALSDGGTRVDRLFQRGCAKIRMPTRHGVSSLDAVMINTSGGVTGGDRLSWEFNAQANTDLTVTTQACEKVYKSAAGTVETRVSISVGPRARLCWLPQETIFFDRCRFRRTIDVMLHETAEAILLESMIFGRQAMGETVRSAQIGDRWRVHLGNRLVHAEEFAVDGNVQALLGGRSTAHGCTAMATLLIVSANAEARLDGLRTVIGDNGGASAFGGKLVARVLAEDGYHLRKILGDIVSLVRPAHGLPKVWRS